jgi:hypothetical protein
MREVQDDPIFLLRELPVNIQVFYLFVYVIQLLKV